MFLQVNSYSSFSLVICSKTFSVSHISEAVCLSVSAEVRHCSLLLSIIPLSAWRPASFYVSLTAVFFLLHPETFRSFPPPAFAQLFPSKVKISPSPESSPWAMIVLQGAARSWRQTDQPCRTSHSHISGQKHISPASMSPFTQETYINITLLQ